jgi:CHRD domain-containing protein
MTKVLAALAVPVLALAGFGLAAAASGKDSFALTANLKARFAVPKPKGVPVGAAGLFTGKAVESSNDKAKLTWRLTFSHLSGRAIAAHIHTGRPGKAGGVLVPLCAPCRSGQRGSTMITHAQLQTIRSGSTYVNVHTSKNGLGEIRGQLKSSGTPVESTSTATTTETSTGPGPVYP